MGKKDNMVRRSDLDVIYYAPARPHHNANDGEENPIINKERWVAIMARSSTKPEMQSLIDCLTSAEARWLGRSLVAAADMIDAKSE